MVLTEINVIDKIIVMNTNLWLGIFKVNASIAFFIKILDIFIF